MKKFFIIITITLIGFALYYFLYLRNARDKKMMIEGSILIERIEEYRKKNGKPPISLEDAGINTPAQGADELFYTLGTDSIVYMIMYGDGLGESRAYYSDTKEWGRFVGRLP